MCCPHCDIGKSLFITLKNIHKYGFDVQNEFTFLAKQIIRYKISQPRHENLNKSERAETPKARVLRHHLAFPTLLTT